MCVCVGGGGGGAGKGGPHPPSNFQVLGLIMVKFCGTHPGLKWTHPGLKLYPELDSP